ncbi:uncharacterized protein LOC132613019 [Lycium barbarum]|uniref:uncharacterized protein LOC132613019 n=1 Tax=Lycium barbarum TaxID=112863 RepID=UPI00293F769F|nr:uncharacterized protein LOC132613019 [Lycium barbarum]
MLDYPVALKFPDDSGPCSSRAVLPYEVTSQIVDNLPLPAYISAFIFSVLPLLAYCYHFETNFSSLWIAVSKNWIKISINAVDNLVRVHDETKSCVAASESAKRTCLESRLDSLESKFDYVMHCVESLVRLHSENKSCKACASGKRRQPDLGYSVNDDVKLDAHLGKEENMLCKSRSTKNETSPVLDMLCDAVVSSSSQLSDKTQTLSQFEKEFVKENEDRVKEIAAINNAFQCGYYVFSSNEASQNVNEAAATVQDNRKHQSFKRVTGLSITEPPRSFYTKYNKTNDSRLLRRYFGVEDGKRNLEMRDLKNVMSAENVDFEDDLDAVMLAEVYILGRVLLGAINLHISMVKKLLVSEEYTSGKRGKGVVDESPDNSSGDGSESEDANIAGKSTESSSLERRIEFLENVCHVKLDRILNNQQKEKARMDQLISALQKVGLNFESQSASDAENVRRHVDSPRHVEKGRRKSTRSVRKSAATKRKTKQAMSRKNVEQSSIGQRKRSVQSDVGEDIADLEQMEDVQAGSSERTVDETELRGKIQFYKRRKLRKTLQDANASLNVAFEDVFGEGQANMTCPMETNVEQVESLNATENVVVEEQFASEQFGDANREESNVSPPKEHMLENLEQIQDDVVVVSDHLERDLSPARDDRIEEGDTLVSPHHDESIVSQAERNATRNVEAKFPSVVVEEQLGGEQFGDANCEESIVSSPKRDMAQNLEQTTLENLEHIRRETPEAQVSNEGDERVVVPHIGVMPEPINAVEPSRSEPANADLPEPINAVEPLRSEPANAD